MKNRFAKLRTASLLLAGFAALAWSSATLAHVGGSGGHGGGGGGHFSGGGHAGGGHFAGGSYRGGYAGRTGYGGYRGGYRGGYGGRGGYRGGYDWGNWGWGGLGIGLYFATLPYYYSTIWYAGAPYYYADDNYYQYDGNVGQYETVTPPADVQHQVEQQSNDLQSHNLIAYPKNGQTEAQQAKDKSDCSTWAISQGGADPSQTTNASPNKNSDYMRAQAACLEGRGYSVQ